MPVWVQWTSFVLGTVGAVLGVMSTWGALTRNTPRILVRALWCGERREPGRTLEITSRHVESLKEFPEGELAIEAINSGYVSVYVREVGVCPRRYYWFQRLREFKAPVGRGVVLQDAAHKITLPYKLEPGSRIQIKSAKASIDTQAVCRAGLVYLLTEDERLFTGSSALLRAIVKAQQQPRT